MGLPNRARRDEPAAIEAGGNNTGEAKVLFTPKVIVWELQLILGKR
jgi:hypothetical protein